jgi:biotin carboxylase
MVKPDAVWIVGGGHLQVPVVREAYKQGYQVILSDMDDACPALLEGQVAHFAKISTYDHEQHVNQFEQHSKHFNVVGCFTAGADIAPTVAHLSAKAGTPGIEPGIAERSHDKARVRYTLDHAKLQSFQPSWKHYDLSGWKYYDDPLGKIVDDITESYESGYFGDSGIVVKPVSKSGSRGVSILPNSICKNKNFIRTVCQQVIQYGRDILVERRMFGTEHSCEVLFNQEHQMVYFNVVDRPFSYDNGIAMELGHVSPTNLQGNVINSIVDMVLQAAKALEVNWGAFKCDVIVTESGPKILESTARLSGGFDCSWTTPISTGRNPIGALLRLSTGHDVNQYDETLLYQNHGYAACHAIFPKEGEVEAIQGDLFIEPTLEELREGKRYLSLITCKPGDQITYEHCATRAGFAIIGADSYDHAWNDAKIAAKNLEKRIFIK